VLVRFFLFITKQFNDMSYISVTDQLRNIISIPTPPSRIVSLVPSQTEFLFSLGLEDHVVGITKFCVHPPHWIKSKAIVGGTKNFDIDRIAALQPDLIIGNKEENVREGIESLRKHFPVWMSDISSLPDAYEMMEKIGLICGKEREAHDIISQIKHSFNRMSKRPSMSVLYFIWGKPFMVAGTQTFINALLQLNNLVNLAEGRYPELSNEEITKLNPDLVLLSSEPFPFQEKHFNEMRALLPDSKIHFVDGEMFSWYGSRLLHAADYFQSLPF
jgi:ABC-type Fe3+-hydroxamate transport system substrate-binding protein